MFDAVVRKDEIIQNIQNWFDQNGKEAKAVIGISGGKDSTVSAALLVRALGKDRVIGVLMPNGKQSDIEDSRKVVEILGITAFEINIGPVVSSELYALSYAGVSPSKDTKINLPPRIRMATLYAVAQSLKDGGRVINTCNYSEDYTGYSSKFGDAAGDISILGRLYVSEILAIGDTMEELPYELVHKTPSDGLCGKSDEDRFGFTYADIETYVEEGTTGNPEIDQKILMMHKASRHKYTEMYVC